MLCMCKVLDGMPDMETTLTVLVSLKRNLKGHLLTGQRSNST